jgi:hypothetical protein
MATVRDIYQKIKTAFNGELFDDLGDLQALPILSPEQMDGLELSMCAQGSMAQQDGSGGALYIMFENHVRS